MKGRNKLIVGVLNFSGNVGKSTLAKHLLKPRIPGAEIIAVETINSDDQDEGDRLRGEQFGMLMNKLLQVDSAIVDFGASNIEDVVSRMSQYAGSHENFDYFVVPVVPEVKQIRDTIATIETLAHLGIPAEKILVVMNRVKMSDDPTSTFSALFKAAEDTHAFVISPAAIVHENELYDILKVGGLTVDNLLGETSKLKAAIKATKDPTKKAALANQVAAMYLAKGVLGELDAVFSALFGQAANEVAA